MIVFVLQVRSSACCLSIWIVIVAARTAVRRLAGRLLPARLQVHRGRRSESRRLSRRTRIAAASRARLPRCRYGHMTLSAMRILGIGIIVRALSSIRWVTLSTSDAGRARVSRDRFTLHIGLFAAAESRSPDIYGVSWLVTGVYCGDIHIITSRCGSVHHP